MEINVRILGAVMRIITLLFWPFKKYFDYQKQTPIPPLKSPLLTLSAVELSRKIRNREVTSREVVETYIQRIREINPIINAVVEERFAGALEDADKVDKFLSSTKLDADIIEKQTLFLGVPFTAKESCAVKGLSFTVGSVFRKGIKASDNGVAVQKLIESGAILLLVSNVPEYCMSWETNNHLTGVTLNPYDLHRTPGGSSGGEGALLGSGSSLIGIGSDIAGSIRLPAMYNGIYGHKPSPGVISITGHFPNSSNADFEKFLTIGPMTRYVEDLKPMLKILSGENASVLRLDEEVDISKINVFYKEDAGYSLVAVPVDHEIKWAIRDAAAFMKNSHGCKVEELVEKDLEDSIEICTSVFFGMKGLPNILDSRPPKMNENFSWSLEMIKIIFGFSDFTLAGLLFLFIAKHNLFIPREKYNYYYERNGQLRKRFNNTLKDNGVFIYPTSPVAAVYHNESYCRVGGVLYTMLFNTIQLPSTHVPIGLNRKGLPIGFQVVAGENQDRLCLAVAKALEARFGGWVPPPSMQS